MAMYLAKKQASFKLLKLCSTILQTRSILPEHFHVTGPCVCADSKLQSHHIRTPKFNLNNFVSAVKSMDGSINTIEDINGLRKIDWDKIVDPFFVSVVKSWEQEQNKLKKKLIVHDTEEWAEAIDGDREKGIKGVKYIGGVDVSFIKDDPYKACAAYVILQYPSLNLIYKDIKTFELTVPYICGFLAFREITPYQELIQRQRKEHPYLGPDVIMVDGNGLLHSKGFGMACHLGVLTDIPCIGVAKNLLLINDIQMCDSLKAQLKMLNKPGDTLPLVGESGTVYGMALKSTDSTREIYVSSGYRVSLQTAVNVVARCCQYRIPEPIRLADHLSRVHVRDVFGTSRSTKGNSRKKELKGLTWLQHYLSKQFYKDTRSVMKKTINIFLSNYYRQKKIMFDKKTPDS